MKGWKFAQSIFGTAMKMNALSASQLDEHQHRGEVRALASADDEQARDRRDSADRNEVHAAALHGEHAGLQRQRHVDSHAMQQSGHVAGPPDRDRSARDRVLQDQIPADQPRHELADHDIRVRVGAAGDGHHRRELCVGQRGEPAHRRRNDERKHQARSGALGADCGENEDAGAYHGADAEQHELERAERAFQALARRRLDASPRRA